MELPHACVRACVLNLQVHDVDMPRRDLSRLRRLLGPDCGILSLDGGHQKWAHSNVCVCAALHTDLAMADRGQSCMPCTSLTNLCIGATYLCGLHSPPPWIVTPGNLFRGALKRKVFVSSGCATGGLPAWDLLVLDLKRKKNAIKRGCRSERWSGFRVNLGM